MAKVVVIDVNLGIDLNTIIAECAQELTGNAKKELEGAIALAESIKKLKDQKEEIANKQVSGLATAMEKAYQKLESNKNGVPVNDIMAIVSEFVPNSSALTTRIQTILKSKGNPHRLIRCKIGSIPHYLFTPFNETPGSESQ